MEATTNGLTGLFFLLAVVLLGAVTLGVGYLTYTERRDRQGTQPGRRRSGPNWP